MSDDDLLMALKMQRILNYYNIEIQKEEIKLFQEMLRKLEEKEMQESNIYTITIESRYVLTQTQLKEALGTGYKVLSVACEKDIKTDGKVINVDTAALEIIKTGYRALARAFHPDLGGDEDTMKILNQTKREMIDLIQSL